MKIINLITILAILFLLESCNQVQNKDDGSKNMITQKKEIQIILDSITVKYWKNTEANEYRFLYSKGILEINSEYLGFQKKIQDKDIKDKFLVYINNLYVEKHPIILTKKAEPIPVSDYSEIEAIGFVDRKKLFDKKTTLYSNIEFSPQFMELYKFLDSLVTGK